MADTATSVSPKKKGNNTDTNSNLNKRNSVMVKPNKRISIIKNMLPTMGNKIDDFGSAAGAKESSRKKTD